MSAEHCSNKGVHSARYATQCERRQQHRCQSLTPSVELDVFVKDRWEIVAGWIPQVGLTRPCPHDKHLRTLRVSLIPQHC